MLKTALEILKIINDNGYEGIIVGGFVRDYLLKIDNPDIDMATNMPYDLLSKLFDINDNKYLSYIIKKNNYEFEITLFRKELSYEKQRHPNVELVNSFKEDYIRRDFTINALGFNYKLDLIDYCKGSVDLSNKLIKTVREPNLTFIEDPVRMLRGIYFKNKINFKFDKQTYNSLLNNIEQLSSISYKRIFIELEKMCNNFKLNLNDLIKTNAYKYLKDLDNTLLFIYDKNINIDSIYDIFEIHYYLGNSLTNWEFNSSKKKLIKEYIDLSKLELNNRIVFDVSEELFILSNSFNKKVNNIDNKKIYYNIKNNLIINNIKEINFDLKDINKYVDSNKIKIIKDNIINLILDNKLINNNTDILNYIISVKNI